MYLRWLCLLCWPQITALTTMNIAEQLTDDELVLHGRRAAAMPEAPPGLINAAVALWSTSAMARDTAAGPGLFQRILASLSFDSWDLASPKLAVRSLRSETRHLLFAAQGRDIDLRIKPAGAAFALAGQVLGPDESGEIELTSLAEGGGVSARRTTLDPLGAFALDDLDAGNYSLTLRLGHDEIVLPPLHLGAPSA